jgi:U3 small nucleolar RNA-associated protein 7
MERLKLSGKADLEGEEDGDVGGAGDADEDEGEEGGEKRQKTVKDKNKMRGKNKSLKRHLRKKRKNIIDPATVSFSFYLHFKRGGLEELRLPFERRSRSSGRWLPRPGGRRKMGKG